MDPFSRATTQDKDNQNVNNDNIGQSSQMPVSLDDFVNNLMNQKGLSSLEPPVVERIKKQLLQRIQRRINLAILENIPEEKRSEFDAITNAKDDDRLKNFYKENIPNIDEIIGNELVEFAKLYLSEK